MPQEKYSIYLIFQISISQNTKQGNKTGFFRQGHIATVIH